MFMFTLIRHRLPPALLEAFHRPQAMSFLLEERLLQTRSSQHMNSDTLWPGVLWGSYQYHSEQTFRILPVMGSLFPLIALTLLSVRKQRGTKASPIWLLRPGCGHEMPRPQSFPRTVVSTWKAETARHRTLATNALMPKPCGTSTTAGPEMMMELG